MANTNTKRIIFDGPRNAVVELIGELDTSGASFAVSPAIDLDVDFVNNEIGPTLVGLRLDEVQYSLSDGLSARLFWDATADQPIVALAGHDKMCFEEASGAVPNRSAAGYTGDIDLLINNIVVAAGTPIQVYTILLYLIKLYDV